MCVCMCRWGSDHTLPRKSYHLVYRPLPKFKISSGSRLIMATKIPNPNLWSLCITLFGKRVLVGVIKDLRWGDDPALCQWVPYASQVSYKREAEAETEIERGRQRETEREGDRQKYRQRDREREGDKKKERHRKTEIERQKGREKQMRWRGHGVETQVATGRRLRWWEGCT